MGSLVSIPLPLEAIAVDDDPRGDSRTGLIVLGAFGSLFVGWMAITPLDAAAVGQGQIAVSGHNQLVQHREGGVVKAIDVVEGQRVRAGQVLVELAPDDVGAQAAALRSQILSLEAQKARLMAEIENRPAIAWPAVLTGATGDDAAPAREAMAVQQAQFESGRSALRAQQAVGSHRAAGLSQQIAGGSGQLEANTKQQALIEQQLAGVRSLAEKGYASVNSIRALERSAAELKGAHDQYAANIADYRQQIAEAQAQSLNLVQQRAENAAAALRETQDQLNQLTPKFEAVRQQLSRSTIKATTDGQVTGLSVFAPGAVVAPGQRLMEIVPSHPSLVVDARIASTDIEGVRTGQVGEVRFSSLSARGVPVLKGRITKLSADSFTDERTGQNYYTAEVTVPKSELDLVGQVRDADSAIRPGVPVQVMIPLRKRNAFQYLFEPLSQALWKSFRQK